MMKRNAILLSLLVVLILAGAGTGFVLLLYHEPAFYRSCEIPAGPDRAEASKKCLGRFITRLGNPIWNNDSSWGVDFTGHEINSFLQEDFFNKWPDSKTLQRQGISDVRIAFEPENHIRLGFRYGNKPWQTIMSFDLRVWLVPKEVNLLAVELVSRRAGALPVSAQSLLTLVAEQFNSKYVELSWYRHNGNPVALVRFQSDGSRATFQLLQVAVEQGMLTIGGKSLESGSQASH